MATTDDLNSTGQNISKQIGQLVKVFTGRALTGTFTLSAATATVVAQASVQANSVIVWGATNATAALTERTAGLFNSAKTPGASFTMSTQSGTAFGTETFQYVMLTPQ